MLHQGRDKIFRFGRGKLFVEMNDEQVANAQLANQRDFVLRRRQQMGCAIWPQNLFRVRIERNYDRRSVFGARVVGGS